MVPDDTLTIRERAIAAWPTAWHGQNLRDILTTLGYDVDRPWRELPKKDRDWILFTDEQPTVPVYAGYTPAEMRRALKRKEEPSYMGTFTGARRYVLHTFANTAERDDEEAGRAVHGEQRVSRSATASGCGRESLSVKFAGLDIADMSRLPLKRLAAIFRPTQKGRRLARRQLAGGAPGEGGGRQRIAEDLVARLAVLLELGLGYLTLERSTPTLCRRASCNGCGLAPRCTPICSASCTCWMNRRPGFTRRTPRRCCARSDRLKASGNSLFVVEHELDVIRHADWIVDVGPAAGEHGGPGPLQRTRRRAWPQVEESRTRALPVRRPAARLRTPRPPRAGCGSAGSRGITSTTSTSPFRWACSPPSPASPARASRAW